MKIHSENSFNYLGFSLHKDTNNLTILKCYMKEKMHLFEPVWHTENLFWGTWFIFIGSGVSRIFKKNVFVKFISVKGERKEHYVKYLIYNAFLNTILYFHLGMHCSMLIGMQRVKSYQNLYSTLGFWPRLLSPLIENVKANWVFT